MHRVIDAFAAEPSPAALFKRSHRLPETLGTLKPITGS